MNERSFILSPRRALVNWIHGGFDRGKDLTNLVPVRRIGDDVGMMPFRASVLLVCLIGSPAHADTLGADPNDSGKVTLILKGRNELDASGIVLLSQSKVGDGDSQLRFTALASPLGYQRFIKNNLSVGGSVLASYDRLSSSTHSLLYGGMAFGSVHLRFGYGVFWRPTLGFGVLYGSLNQELTPGVVAKSSQFTFVTRIAFPLAYFMSPRWLLQAGPEINLSVGSASPDGGGDSQSITSITGGFGLGVGYSF